MSEKSRNDKWSSFDDGSKIRLISDDLDSFDQEIKSFHEEVSGIKKLLMGVLISTATGTLLFALNLVAGK